MIITIRIYTEGSKTINGVGAAFLVYDESFSKVYSCSKRLNNESNVFMAELIAINETLNYIKINGNIMHKRAYIISDSMSALQVITSPCEDLLSFILTMRDKI